MPDVRLQLSVLRPAEDQGAVTSGGRPPLRPVHVSDIQHAVTEHYGFHEDALLTHRRYRKFSRARQLAMWLAQEMTDHSFVVIGNLFDRDHTTVMYACKVMPARLGNDSDLRADCQAIAARIELLRRCDPVPYPRPVSRGPGAAVDDALTILMAAMRRDPAGTMAKLIRRTADAADIENG